MLRRRPSRLVPAARPVLSVRAVLAAPVLLASLVACDTDRVTIRVELRDEAGGVPEGAVATLVSSSSGEVLISDTVRGTGDLTWTVPHAGAAVAVFARDASAESSERARLRVLLQPGTEVVVRVLVDRGVPTVRLADRAGVHARWAAALEGADEVRARHSEAHREPAVVGGDEVVGTDWTVGRDSLLAAVRAEPEIVVREALWFQLLVYGRLGAELDPDTWSEALDGIRPASPVWSALSIQPPAYITLAARRAAGVDELGTSAGDGTGAATGNDVGSPEPGAGPGLGGTDPEAAAGRRTLANRRALEYFRRGAAEHPDPHTRAIMLLGEMRMAVALGDAERASEVYERLEAEYAETNAFRFARAEAPGVALAEGDEIPTLAFPSLDSTAPPIAPADLAQRTVLIDFWAVWCVPCVAEMPTLHAAHERFAGRGFEILSVSFDRDPATVRNFRAERWPMPWLHSFVGLDRLSDGEIAVRYGVMGLPTAVLVGPDGRILAVDRGLRGEALMETLEAVLP